MVHSRFIGSMLFLALIMLASADSGHFGYSQAGGEWTGTCAEGKLSQANIFIGKTQSPINIISEKAIPDDEIRDVWFEYAPKVNDATVVHRPHKLQVDYTGATLELDNGDEMKTWTSAQFHFHSPSEHRIDGKTFDAEMHMVFLHEGSIAVLGVLFQVDDAAGPNKFIESLQLDQLNPDEDGELTGLTISLDELYENLDTQNKYHYVGSLTTPPCTEGVNWFVYPSPSSITTEQLDTLADLVKDATHEDGEYGNNRNAFETEDRDVYLLTFSYDFTKE